MKLLIRKSTAVGILCATVFLFLFLNSAGAVNVTPEDIEAAQRVSSELSQKEQDIAKNFHLDNPEMPSGIEAGSLKKVIIKFVSGSEPENVLREAGVDIISLDKNTVSLPAYTEGNVKGAIGKTLKKDSDGWFWFLGKKYEENTGVPQEDFLIDYTATLGENITLSDAIIKLRNNPKIEYAMPAYLLKQNLPQ